MKLSAVVPVLNEAARIDTLLTELRPRGRTGPNDLCEVIVVDGGSTDDTRQRAEQQADRVLTAPGGLAEQLNAGAEAAIGDTLLFVYADTQLPSGWCESVRAACEATGCVGGAFRLALDDPRWRYRFVAFASNLRTQLGCGPFGDQALFVRRDAFEEVGGYDGEALLEDLDLMRRLRRHGRIQVLSDAATSSVRRWEAQGFWNTSIQHWKFLFLHALGRRRGRTRGHYRRTRQVR